MEKSTIAYLETVVISLEVKQLAESIVKISAKRPSTGLNTVP